MIVNFSSLLSPDDSPGLDEDAAEVAVMPVDEVARTVEPVRSELAAGVDIDLVGRVDELLSSTSIYKQA